MIIGISQEKYEQLLGVLWPDIDIDEWLSGRCAKITLREVLDILGVTLKVDGGDPDLEIPLLAFDFDFEKFEALMETVSG